MDVRIDVTQNLKRQFAAQLGIEERDDGFMIHPDIGTNKAKSHYLEFPGELEFYHFGRTQFKVPIHMTTISPPDTEWFIVHVNLSKVKQTKEVEGREIEFQKYLPIGILLYGPGLEIKTLLPTGTDSEVATIRFSSSFLNSYFESEAAIIDRGKSLIYEDFDDHLEKKFHVALSNIGNKLICHAHVLDFLQAFFAKINKHDHTEEIHDIHPEDLNAILTCSVHLRNPLADNHLILFLCVP